MLATLKRTLACTFVALALAGCASNSNDSADAADTGDSGSGSDTNNGTIGDLTPPAAPPSTPGTPAQSARYRITFNSTWSATTHPQDFPSNPHFSGLIGAVHNEQVIFWESGQIATDGIEQMAETGGKSLFRAELNAAIDEGKANALIDAGGIGSSPGTVSTEVTVTRDFPEITVTSMLAPSPDWFIGVHNLSLLNDDNTFATTLTRDLRLYDAGTDSGPSYTSANADTSPRDPIALLGAGTTTLAFSNGEPVVGQLVIEKIE